MPSHIDVLVGDYENGIWANEDAIAADEVFLAREGPLNFYVRHHLRASILFLFIASFRDCIRLIRDNFRANINVLHKEIQLALGGIPTLSDY